MEMKLFKKNKEDWTRVKIPVKELNSVPAMAIKFFGYEPTEVTDKFTWYELKGDFLMVSFNNGAMTRLQRLNINIKC